MFRRLSLWPGLMLGLLMVAAPAQAARTTLGPLVDFTASALIKRPGGRVVAPARYACSGPACGVAAAKITASNRRLKLLPQTAVWPVSCRVTGCELDKPPSTAIAWPLT